MGLHAGLQWVRRESDRPNFDGLSALWDSRYHPGAATVNKHNVRLVEMLARGWFVSPGRRRGFENPVGMWRIVVRLLVVADIHGNRAALEAIPGSFDQCVCLGDLVDYGPEPGPCIEWVRRHATFCVRGNHDHGVAQDVVVQGLAGFRFLTASTRPLSVAALDSSQRRFLADLPTSRMFSVGGKRFLLVHATPRDPMDEYALPDPGFWAPRLAGLKIDYLLAGHTHQPYVLRVNNTTVVNPGSVGLNRDGDPRAAYAIIEGDEVTLHRVAYPIEQTITASDQSVPNSVARQMLADIYRGKLQANRWAGDARGPEIQAGRAETG